MGQIRAGFHHDAPAGGPSDVESKLIRLYAETGITGLNSRLPERGRTPAKRRPPPRGDLARDGHGTAGADVSRDGDGAVIGRVQEVNDQHPDRLPQSSTGVLFGLG